MTLATPKDRFQLAKERLAKNPDDFEAHLILAEEFLNNHRLKEAEQELLLARQIKGVKTPGAINQETQVLGKKTTLSLESLWQRKEESD